MLDIKLETLLVTAEEQNFTKAAEILNLTQPAVSNHIAHLENETGVKIFYRSKGKVRVTPEGEIVIRYAKRIKALYNRMHEKIEEYQTARTASASGSRIPPKATRSRRILPNSASQNRTSA